MSRITKIASGIFYLLVLLTGQADELWLKTYVDIDAIAYEEELEVNSKLNEETNKKSLLSENEYLPDFSGTLNSPFTKFYSHVRSSALVTTDKGYSIIRLPLYLLFNSWKLDI
tara:strand:+ start:276 stop:614 length:339 start_codon:yes stop_codon:yes gene_type:complete